VILSDRILLLIDIFFSFTDGIALAAAGGVLGSLKIKKTGCLNLETASLFITKMIWLNIGNIEKKQK
jgi:hypothetical protein